MTLDEKLQNLPDAPGVYLMKNAKGHVLYVGKALSLKSRVRSYFQKGAKGEKTEMMLRHVTDLETIVTHTELEALALESNLIKKHRPRYNVILRDDKNYPYLRFDTRAEYPRLEVVRRLKKDGALYYGPYVPAGGMWETLALIRRTFPLATCKMEFRKDRPERPCVQFQIGRCMAPCAGEADGVVYQDMVSQVRLFLEGKNRDLIDMLKRRMEEASEGMEFERAGELRDRISKIEGSFEKQKIISQGFENQDVIGIASEGGHGDIQVLFIRNGMLLGRKDFSLDDVRGMSNEEILTDFLHQFYGKEMIVPPEVLLPFDVPDQEVFEAWLAEKRDARVEVQVPQRGRKRELVQMASDNAAQTLREQMLSRKSKERILMRLQEELGLRNLPQRIEAFDISTIQGTESVGSMVAFENNQPDKRHYKRFRIKTVAGQDDFAAMAEVVRRRYARDDVELPDLVLIDGGKGQLNATLGVLQDLGIDSPDVIGLAKARSGDEGEESEFERVFLPGESEPIILPPASTTTHLLARVRDESHRFAITYHRTLRAKRAVHSELDDIPGIGETRKKALLRHFGSVAKIREASVDDLAAVKGMSKKAAEEIFTYYRKFKVQSSKFK
ncbi:MAG TPA: excinuclease ABC subunit C [Nitrospiraceae bacterium]|nr:excinuclease ABC subunit C [Nitrospiraceae bacterium]